MNDLTPGRQITGPGTSEWMAYKPGTVTSTGETVLEILQLSTKGVVFLNPGGELTWEYDDSTPNGLGASGQANGLIAQLSVVGLSRSSLRRVHLLIAAGLSSAFDDTTRRETAEFFGDARAFLLARQTESLQSAHLLSVLASGAALASAALYVASTTPSTLTGDFALVAAMGSVGAVVSVSQRFRAIPIERYASRSFTAIAGVCRVLFGGLFGVVFLLLQRSGIILSIVGDSGFALAAAGLVAGFSERLIPDLVQTIEGSILKTG